MKRLTDEIVRFFRRQSFTVVVTVDQNGYPHTSCKGIVKINRSGKIYLLDLYTGNTFENLKRNPRISVTAAEEHRFKGYCLKGRAKIVERDKLTPTILRAWRDRIAGRITSRLIKNVQGGSRHFGHPEAQLPAPQYLIVMEVREIVDLTPQHIK